MRAGVGFLLRRYGTHHISGQEHIPADGPVLFVSNHLSNVDAFCLQLAYGRDVTFMAGVKLKANALTRLTVEIVPTIPIRPGAPDKEAIKAALDALKAGKRIHIFPEGGRSRTGGLIEGKPGALLIARMSKVPIVPIGLMGTEKLFPINDADMANERLQQATVTVRVGRPFHLEDLAPVPAGHADPKRWQIDQVMLRIAELVDPPYRGIYGETAES